MSGPMSIDTQLVQQKAKYIAGDLKLLQQALAEYAYEELVTDEVQMSLAERRLERIVNRAVDINTHLIRAAEHAPPDDYTESFRILGELKVLTPEQVKNVAPAAGARNVLAHDYDDLDARQFYASLESAVKYFPGYLKAVVEFAEKQATA